MFSRRTAPLLLTILVIVPAAAAQDGHLWVGPNVNMVSGTTWPDGDPFLQRQNEPSIAVSTRNPMHLMAASNDYRTVDLPGLPEGLPTGDSWIGVYTSLDGGGSWTSTLLPGYPQDDTAEGQASPIYGLQAAADPVKRAGTHGMFYLSGIVFDRGDLPQSKLFVARYMDLNNDPHNPIQYIDTVEVAFQPPGSTIFIDKPWLAADIPRSGAEQAPIEIPQDNGAVYCGNLYLAWAEIDSSTFPLTSRILSSYSTDCGGSWSEPIQLNATGTLAQGATIAVAPDTGYVHVGWRQFSVATQNCVLGGGGYWKNAPDAWPVDTINLGGITYSKQAAIDILETPKKEGTPYIVAQQLIPAKLNVFSGAVNSEITQVISDADTWLAANHFGSKPSGVIKDEGVTLGKQLEEFNKGEDDPGTCIAITTGYPDAILVASSIDEGQTYGGPVLVSEFSPFDQGTTELSFRTNAYPTMTIDHVGRLYLAWATRGLATGANSSPVSGDTRIVVSTSVDGDTWTLPQPIDQPEVPGHQIKPSLTYINGQLFLVYCDFREDMSEVFERFVVDYLTPDRPYRHTADVRVAVADPGAIPDFTDYSLIPGSDPAELVRPSTQASKYLFMPTMHGTGLIFEQLEFNPPNLPMFKAGTVPFFGDYVDIAGSPPFIPDGNSGWVYNTDPLGTPTAHAVWTDNRDVVGPPPPDFDWTYFVPPGSGGTSVFDGVTEVPACNPFSTDVDRTQIRNQNIYTAKVTNGLTVSVPGNSRPLNDTFTRGFVVFVQNDTPDGKFFRLLIPDQPPGGQASFDQFQSTPITMMDVAIERYSSVSHTVFATSTDANASIPVHVTEISGVGGSEVGGLQSTVLINPDPSNPTPADPSVLTGEIHTPAVFNPAVYNPAVYNPAVLNPAVFNPAVFNPAVFNPAVFNDAVLNYNVENPAVFNPAVFNPAVLNPAVFNPAVLNMALMNPAVFNPAVLNPAVFNPAVLNPAVFNPAVFNPAVFNPAVLNPAVLNPAVFNPAVFNPAVLNPAVFNPAVLNPAVFNTTFADESATDFNLVAENRGNTTSSYTVNLALNSDPPGFKYQLLIYRLYFTPVVDQCTVTEAAQQELLVNDLDPDMHANLLDEGENSFYLDPGDQAVITLRILPDPDDPNPGDPSQYPLEDVSGSVVADKENTDDEADGDTGGDVSTFLGNSVPPINVTSSPTPPDATDGVAYSFTFTATGGTGPLTWSFAPGSTPPPGFSLTPGGIFGGTPSSPGSFVFLVQVTDSATQLVTQTVTLTVNAIPMIPLAQRNALIALYNSTNGDGWTNNTGWKTGGVPSPRGTECSWVGVTCGSPKVDWIDLSYNNLNGPIPIEIGNLADLRGLNLESNLLTGQIPDQIGNLANLEDLHLANNQLTGPIPPQLASATNLRWLHVGDNQLSGAIPLQIGNLSNLQFIYLQRNNLTGPIPNGIGNLSNLESLSLYSNQLSGPIPPQLGNLIALKWLNLNYNQLSGTIPVQLGNIGTLQSLALYGNQLIGTIPEELGDVTLLNYLNLGNNLLNGIIPADLGDLSNLEMLILDNNQLSGLIPAQLGNLPKLIYLNLQFNLLAGPIPMALSNLSNLKQMLLSQNQLSGGIPESLGDLDQLEVLSLSSNQLTGTIPSRLADPPNLSWLALGANQLSGSIPVEVGGITNLRYLGLPFNQLSGTIPSELGNLGSLEYLYLNGNQLSGTIPPQLGNLGTLLELLLDQNQITGSIPPELEDLSNLVFLGLGNNRISGTIPSQIANLTNLISLKLQGNRLEGLVPSTFDNLTNLQSNGLDIRWNALLSPNPALTVFLDSKQDGGDWRSTQTVPPTVVTASGFTSDSVVLSWAPVTYTGDAGGYEVLHSSNPGGPYVTNGIRTVDKTVSSIVVSGLNPMTPYVFVVRTVTDPHANNQNTVMSSLTSEESATTLSPLVITTSSLPYGAVGSAYVPYTLTAAGGTGPYSWGMAPNSGPLPDGLGLSASGIITGTPTASGSFDIRVRVTDATRSGEKTLNIQVVPSGGGHVILDQPANSTAGQPIPDFRVLLLDQAGSKLPGYTVSLAIGNSACASATLSPPTPIVVVADGDGIATFSGISIDRGGYGFTLEATSTILASTVSTESEPFGLQGFCEATSMGSARLGATLTRLADGRVLVVGGASQADSFTPPHASAEIFDPATGNWTATGSLNVARSLHTATLLADGRVFVAGGSASPLPASGAALTSAEIFDPTIGSNGLFLPAGSLTVARMAHTATLLSDGRVLIAGGRGSATVPPPYHNTGEIYDPAGGGSFTLVGDLMATPRDSHRATRLNDGRVLLVGGLSAPFAYLSSAEVFDPAGLGGLGEFTNTGSMTSSRINHTSTLLDDGRVLVAGGSDGSGTVAFAEIFDPSILGGSFLGPIAMAGRENHSAARTPSGEIVLMGGRAVSPPFDVLLGSVEIFDPGTAAFSSAHSLITARQHQLTTELADGRLLVAGGTPLASNGFTAAEVFWPMGGETLWVLQSGSSATERASGIAAHTSGVYITGRTDGTLPGQTSAGGSDVFVRKYDQNGSEVWTRQFGSSGADQIADVFVDASGVYLAGATQGILPGQATSGAQDAFLRKYDLSGTEVWTRQFGSTENDGSLGVVVNESGVFVAGYTSAALPGQVSAGGNDAFVRKYDYDGFELWTHQFGSAASDWAAEITTDNSGVFVLGSTYDTLTGQTSSGEVDAFVRKYDFAGGEQWTRQFGTSTIDTARGVAVDPSGVYISGYTYGTFPGQTSSGAADAFVRKFDLSGTEIWTRQFGSAADELAYGAAVDASGVFLAGPTRGTLPGQTNAGAYDAYIRKFDHGGTELWTRQVGSSADDLDSEISVDSSGVYLVGSTKGTLPGQTSSGDDDVFVVKFVP